MEMDQQQRPEEESPIFLVPDIILEENIFARSGNLKNLSLTCKYFHDLISKSRQLMKRFELNIVGKSCTDKVKRNYNQQNLSTILKSKRKYSRIGFYLIYSYDKRYSQLLHYFKDSITKIEFVNCGLKPFTLAETFKTVGGLEDFCFNFSSFSPTAKRHVDVSKFGKFKCVFILNEDEMNDISILHFLPETEMLEVVVDYLEYDDLKQYLEKQTNLTKFSIELRVGNFSLFPEIINNLNLIELKIRTETAHQRRLNQSTINFIKSQAKTLKRLSIERFDIDLNDIQSLLEPMEVLECLELTCSLFHCAYTSSLLVTKKFTCPKLRKLTPDFNDDFSLVDKFPNLEELEISFFSQPKVIVAAAQHCQRIKKLVLQSFDEASLSTAFFPELVDLKIGMTD
jgi:hypothetical protein